MNLRLATFNLENWERSDNFAQRLTLARQQLHRLHADVICFQEVNDIDAFTELLKGTKYANYQMAITTKDDSNEPLAQRNLVVISEHPIRKTDQIRNRYVNAPQYGIITGNDPDAEPREITWERPIQYVQLDVPGKNLHIFNVHFKSKNPTNIPGQKLDNFTWESSVGWAEGYFLSSMKRVGQAVELRMAIDELFNQYPDAMIMAAGDFNGEILDVPVEAVTGRVENTGNGDLSERVLIPCETSVAEDARYSLFHHGKPYMLDHILISKPLLGFYIKTEIHNETLADESVAFATDLKFPTSDHAPVVAEFRG